MPHSWMGRVNIKDVNSPQINLKFIIILMKISIEYFVESDKIILKFVWKIKSRRAAKKILKENKGILS